MPIVRKVNLSIKMLATFILICQGLIIRIIPP